MASMDEMRAAYEEAVQSGDFEQMGEHSRYGTDDFVDEWPQSASA